MKRINVLLILIFLLGCGESQQKQRPESISDQTPILNEELVDTPPDMTLNDIRSVLDIIRGNTEFDSFDKALVSAEMISIIDSIDDVTIFAPVNEAFNLLSDDKQAQLKSPDGNENMTHILKYHMVEDEYDLATLRSTVVLKEGTLRLKTFNGGYIALQLKNDTLVITDELSMETRIILGDQEASNGVVHGIEKILLPQ
ncbi:fasciclin domain-containing protein [Flavobacteriaceae bacterium TP-CH-4]|uniref:Fasciclin domain-containing protein n=1 Tax=Pelagihabitans pacificus TaxID=2696054 RepID=A0A967AVA0_9FLAO|nr:fasciclin domain-containing protein [Pelagihabitans pacificus]NHF61034.1 fasciclin domain-containing protein [Pelagihabitans pacificus]